MNKLPESITQSPNWQALRDHHAEIAPLHMRDLFTADPQRFSKFSLEMDRIFLDYSKNRFTEKTLSLLFKLAETVQLPQAIDNMFSGHPINTTENRAALHTALRRPLTSPLMINDENVMAKIRLELLKMSQLTEKARSKTLLGYTQKPITDIVNIGIGGSGLGPLMATQALTPYHSDHLRCHFISSMDGTSLSKLHSQLNPETTLFIVSSKSFSTLETLTHAQAAKQWVMQSFGTSAAFNKHFVAVTANKEKAKAFGFDDDTIFELWDWVGGRYSLWSSVGLPLALMIGMDNFQEFLAGAYATDQHFQKKNLEQNMPVILGLLSLWYNNFFNAHSHAIIPYDERLKYFPHYLRQAEMESNGKQVTNAGHPVDYSTAPILWGDVGCDAQHSFFQLIYQGTHLVPMDLIATIEPHHSYHSHHKLLISNCLSQSQALMQGTDKTASPAHKIVHGNQPTNTLLFHKLTPFTLGSLIALYEHKIFVQSVIWNINPFDQWGVELGKQLSQTLCVDVKNNKISHAYDASTQGLLEYYCKHFVSDEESISSIK